jgi:hypothetical protein
VFLILLIQTYFKLTFINTANMRSAFLELKRNGS